MQQSQRRSQTKEFFVSQTCDKQSERIVLCGIHFAANVLE